MRRSRNAKPLTITEIEIFITNSTFRRALTHDWPNMSLAEDDDDDDDDDDDQI